LIDSFNSKAALLSQGRHVCLYRVVNTLAVISLLELRHEILPLNFPNQAVIKIALEMVANLRVILSVLYCYQQQETIVGFGSNPPTSIDGQ
jgi:hypothetical protein